MHKVQTLVSALNEEEAQLHGLEDMASSSIRDYERLYDILGVKILSALLFVLVGSAIIVMAFLRERNLKLSEGRCDEVLFPLTE